MYPMMHRSQAHGHARAPGPRTMKEVRSHNLAVTLEVPPLFTGQEETLTVRVSELASSAPVGGASVSVLVGWLDPRSGGRAVEELASTTSLQATEGSEKGVYRATHRFENQGANQILAEVRAREPQPGEPPIVVDVAVRPIVFDGRPMGGARSAMPMLVLGGLAMAVMMGLMLGR